MEWTPEIITSFIGIITTAVVGVILTTQINSKKDKIKDLNTIIESMKSLNDLYNFDKLKSYKEIIELEAEGRYKIKFTERLQTINKESTTEAAIRYINKNANFIESYEEILSIPVNIMLSMSKPDREIHLKNYPKNEKLLRSFLEAIDKGDVSPGSSILETDAIR